MSARRQPPLQNRPSIRANETPAGSGEYRFIGERRKRSSATMPAARPAVARTTATPTHTGPRRYSTVHMQAQRQALPSIPANDATPPLSAGRQIDDDLVFDFDIDADGALELDCVPPSRGAHETPPAPRRMTPSPMARVTPAPVHRMTPPMDAVPPRTASSTMTAVDPHAALVAFAGFGEPPASLWKMPGYALRVARRKRSLRADLRRARARRSNDIDIYEASLRSADGRAVRNGVLMIATLASLVILLLGAAAALWFAR